MTAAWREEEREEEEKVREGRRARREGQIRKEQRHLKERAAALEMRAAYQRGGLQGRNKAAWTPSTRSGSAILCEAATDPKTVANDDALSCTSKLRRCFWTSRHTQITPGSIQPDWRFNLQVLIKAALLGNGISGSHLISCEFENGTSGYFLGVIDPDPDSYRVLLVLGLLSIRIKTNN